LWRFLAALPNRSNTIGRWYRTGQTKLGKKSTCFGGALPAFPPAAHLHTIVHRIGRCVVSPLSKKKKNLKITHVQ
jgi:hypothetical protein